MKQCCLQASLGMLALQIIVGIPTMNDGMLLITHFNAYLVNCKLMLATATSGRPSVTCVPSVARVFEDGSEVVHASVAIMIFEDGSEVVHASLSWK